MFDLFFIEDENPESVKTLNEVVSIVKQVLPGYFPIAGGSVADIIAQRDINDIDVYFRSEFEYYEAVKLLEQYSVIIHSTNYATTFNYNNYTIQLVKFVFGVYEEITDTFDLNVCKVYIDSEYNSDTTSYNIIVDRIHTQTPSRIRKYIDKGYNIEYHEILRITKYLIQNKNTIFQSNYENDPARSGLDVLSNLVHRVILELDNTEHKIELIETILIMDFNNAYKVLENTLFSNLNFMYYNPKYVAIFGDDIEKLVNIEEEHINNAKQCYPEAFI